MKVELSVDADLITTDEVAVTAYYVCAEALANVVKHADATAVTIEVSKQSNRPARRGHRQRRRRRRSVAWRRPARAR